MSSERMAFNDGFDKGYCKALDKIAQLEDENAALKREIPTADDVSRLMGVLGRYRERGPSDLATSDAMLWRKLERLHTLLTQEQEK